MSLPSPVHIALSRIIARLKPLSALFSSFSLHSRCPPSSLTMCIHVSKYRGIYKNIYIYKARAKYIHLSSDVLQPISTEARETGSPPPAATEPASAPIPPHRCRQSCFNGAHTVLVGKGVGKCWQRQTSHEGLSLGNSEDCTPASLILSLN